VRLNDISAHPFHHLLLTAAVGFVAGCSTPAFVVDSSHPASPDAPEETARPFHSSLHTDEPTRHTRELFKQREEQAAAAESESGNPSKPGHEHR
jgi:hypothetical protein